MKLNEQYRRAEHYLYDYKKNLARIEILKGDLEKTRMSASVKAQSYTETMQETGVHSDPVAERIIKIERLENEIKKLERWTAPITSLLNDLNSNDALNGSHNSQLADILRLVYWGGNSICAVCNEMQIARATFFRRKRELVFIAICYFGF